MSEKLQEAFETTRLVEAGKEPSSYKHLVYETEADRQFLEDTLSEIRKTKLGRQLIADAEKYGTTIALVSGMRAYGSFDEVENRLKINAANSKERSVGTMAHELRHAQQFKNGVIMDAYLDTPKSYIQTQGVIEADACVSACEVCYDLALQGNPVFLEELRGKDPHIVNPFQTAAVKNGLKDGSAHQAAFYGWFTDYSTRDCYDINYIKMYEQRRKKASRDEDNIKMERHVVLEDTIAKVCNAGGKSYLGKEAEEFFKSDDACSVSFERFNNIYSNLYFKYNFDYKRGAEATLKEDFGMTVRPHSGYMPRPVVPEPLPIPSLEARQAEAAQKIAEAKASQKVWQVTADKNTGVDIEPVKYNSPFHAGLKMKIEAEKNRK